MVDTGIGDMRSRLVRLIPDNNPENTAIKRFFNHRLPKDQVAARIEWLAVVEGAHDIWTDISTPKRELIRSFLNHFNLEVIKRMRPTSRFDFSRASVGNIFLTGARLFTGSLEAAVYMLSSVCAVPDHSSVLPALNTNFANHIAAGLADGTVVIGQNDISHPSVPSSAVPLAMPSPWTDHADEDANPPGSHHALRRPAIDFSKHDEEELPARIERLWYINPYGQEIRLPANPRVLEALASSRAVVYSIGSLFTSLIPSLVLGGVGEQLMDPLIRSKILILNGTLDRETGPSTNPFTALDMVAAIAGSCAASRAHPALSEAEYSQFITHVIYLDSPLSPRVDRQKFSQLGIETLRAYGVTGPDGKGVRYDPKGLMQALEAIIGRNDRRIDRSRRNTLDA